MAQLLEGEEVLRQHVAWKTPEDEVAGIVRLVKRQLWGNSQMAMDAVYVAVPNKARLAAFTQALMAANVTCMSPKQIIEAMANTEELAFEDFAGTVCVGSYGTIAKMKPVHLYCTGLVEGFFPVGTESEETLAAEAKVLNDVLTQVPGTLIFSSFKRVEAAEADRLRIPALRRRREHGKDVAVVSHSRFIDAMYDDAPTLVSGEQFIMNLFG